MARADRIDDLVKQIGSTNDEERAEAADTLARIGGSRVEKQFREMLASTNPERRQMAVVGLLQISGADEDLERVHAALKDENSTVRWSAVIALQQSGRTNAIPWLEEIGKVRSIRFGQGSRDGSADEVAIEHPVVALVERSGEAGPTTSQADFGVFFCWRFRVLSTT